MTKDRLRRIAKQAFNLAPSAEYIAQDTDSGDWYTYEKKPIFDTTSKQWLPSEISGYAYVCNTDVLTNEPPEVYEISKVLSDNKP